VSTAENEYAKVLRLLEESPNCTGVTEVTGTTVAFLGQVPPRVRAMRRRHVLPPPPVGWTIKLDPDATSTDFHGRNAKLVERAPDSFSVWHLVVDPPALW
jgi:hypothetical protein